MLEKQLAARLAALDRNELKMTSPAILITYARNVQFHALSITPLHKHHAQAVLADGRIYDFYWLDVVSMEATTITLGGGRNPAIYP